MVANPIAGTLVFLLGGIAAAYGAFDVRDFGAMGDGVAKDTVVVQKAIDAAHAAGGGETLENGGEWQYPTNSLHRFFKVTVEMP